MDTQQQIDHLIALAIEQREELSRLDKLVPSLRVQLRSEVELAMETVEPQLRSDLSEFCAQTTEQQIAALRSSIPTTPEQIDSTLSGKVEQVRRDLAASTSERVSSAVSAIDSRVADRIAAVVSKLESAALTQQAERDQDRAALVQLEQNVAELKRIRSEFAVGDKINPRGRWQAGTTYERLDIVLLNGSSYIATEQTDTRPSPTAKGWQLLAQRGAGGGGSGSLVDLTGPGTPGQLLISTGAGFVPANLTAGAGIIITEGPGSIEIESTGGGGGGSGTVTRVALTTDANLTATGSPITTSGTFSLSLNNTTVTPATYGAANTVVTFAVDAKGRITGATSVPVSITSGQISDGVVRSLWGQQGVITSVSYAAFDTTSSITPSTGQLTWDGTEGAVKSGLIGSSVQALLGIDSHIRVLNPTGTNMTKGQAVVAAGSSGTRLSVTFALADSDANTAETLGVCAESITNNQQGYLLTKGLLRGIDTNAFNEGDVLYVSAVTPGALTNVRPSAPNHAVRIGYCIKKAGVADGIVYVDPLNGFELDELHDVFVTSVTGNDSLFYDFADKRWENRAPSAARTALGLGTAAVEAATYFAPATTGTAILAGNGSGGFASVTIGVGLTFSAGTLFTYKITDGTAAPSGGSNRDIYLQYT